ncbi:HAAS signaling domain-containing protein [Caldalkalibacillus mannanilyticus]|uniref:HAAS signaling domain-containing protein n=1 Tax=Caldalkalibacillus mannanilyticus TaxID=1418 RepID=UPI000468A174|nr:DUF1700 domain-containing protein [Caldalkalibacillus mannanilyticus]
MTKKDFLHQLRRHLDGLPHQEVEEILNDMEDHFHLGLEEGKTEQEITKILGDPIKIAKTIKRDYFFTHATENHSWVSFYKGVVMAMGLGFVNLFLIFPLFLLVATVILGLWGSGLLFILSSFVIFTRVDVLTALFNSVLVVGIGLLFIVIGNCAAMHCIKLMLKNVSWNRYLLRGENIEQ